MEEIVVKKLTGKEQKFVYEYLKDFNATQAAIRAGYSKRSAAEIGYENLRKPHIKAEIDKLLDEAGMEQGEITKRFTDIARTDMSDYLVKRLVPFTPQIKVGLKELIENEKLYILREEEFCALKGLTEEEYDRFQEQLQSCRDRILRWEIELKYDPKATRIIDGETVLIEQAELDMVKIVEDKEKGKIKSIKHTREGVQVEMYAADAALANLAKIRGMMIDKSEIDLNANVDTVVRIGYGGDESENSGTEV